ncbi:MAG: peptidylprolyl isomerase [Alphaproteobacteria bacterium]|nr:peptidylprolyl isomerase [Alphaproteobacteria bacterium]
MVMRSMRNSAAAGILKFILFGLLIMAVGGLVLMDVGGFFRNGVPVNDVATVNGQSLSARVFDRSVRGQLGHIGIEPNEAYRLGLVDQILAGEIRSMLLEQGAQDYGILISRDIIAKKIAELIVPMIQPGQTPQQALNQILRSQGMIEEEFIASLRREMAGNLLAQTLTQNATFTTSSLLQDMDQYMGENRDVEYILFPDADVKDIAAPTDAELEDLYQSMRERFARPEMRQYAILRIRESSLKKEVNVPEEDVRKAYESFVADHANDILYTLEQAIVPTQEQATTILEAVKKDKPMKAVIESSFKNKNIYQPPQAALLESWAEPMQADLEDAQPGDIIGPTQSIKGWHVARVIKIENAAQRPYDELKGDLRRDLEEGLLRDKFDAIAAQVDDMAAAGAMSEEIAQEHKIERLVLPAMSATGIDAQGKDALKAHEYARKLVLETGPRLRSGEVSRMHEEERGTYLALALEKVEPKSYPPLAEVKDVLSKEWQHQARQRENRAELGRAITEAASLNALSTKTGQSVRLINGMTRSSDKLPFTQGTDALFAAPVNEVLLLETRDGLAAAQVKAINWSPPATKEKIEALRQTLNKQMAEEALSLTLMQLQADKGVQINKPLLARLYGSTDTESE